MPGDAVVPDLGGIENHRVQPLRLFAESVSVRVWQHVDTVDSLDGADVPGDVRRQSRVMIDGSGSGSHPIADGEHRRSASVIARPAHHEPATAAT